MKANGEVVKRAFYGQRHVLTYFLFDSDDVLGSGFIMVKQPRGKGPLFYPLFRIIASDKRFSISFLYCVVNL